MTATVFDQFRYMPVKEKYSARHRQAVQTMTSIEGRLNKLLVLGVPAQKTYDGAKVLAEMLMNLLLSMWNGLVDLCRRMCGMASVAEESKKIAEARAAEEAANRVPQQPSQQQARQSPPSTGLSLAAAPGASGGARRPSPYAAAIGGAPATSNAAFAGYSDTVQEDEALKLAFNAYNCMLSRLEQIISNPDFLGSVQQLIQKGGGEKLAQTLTNNWQEDLIRGEALTRKDLIQALSDRLAREFPEMTDIQSKASAIVSGLPADISWDVLGEDVAAHYVGIQIEQLRAEILEHLQLRAGANIVQQALRNDSEGFFEAIKELMSRQAQKSDYIVDDPNNPIDGDNQKANMNRMGGMKNV